MEEVKTFGNTFNWISIISTLFIPLCFYFTLTFFQHLKKDDERLIKQTKLAAVICLALALLVPAFYNLYMINQMMK